MLITFELGCVKFLWFGTGLSTWERDLYSGLATQKAVVRGALSASQSSGTQNVLKTALSDNKIVEQIPVS